MISLKSLRFSGIGRFVEESFIDFTGKSRLLQADGKNLNTGGSSGAGKSTVFNAIDYAFGLSDIPSTILKTRLSKSPISVEVIISTDSGEYKILRGAGVLSVENMVTGEITDGNSKLVEEKIDQIIGIPRSLFRPMVHKRQKEGGFFLSFTPQKSHEFVSECLGLKDWTTKQQRASADISASTKKIESLELSVSGDRSVIDSVKASLSGLEKPKLKIDPSLIDVYKDKISKTQVEIDFTSSEVAKKLFELRATFAPIAEFTSDIYNLIKEIDGKIKSKTAEKQIKSRSYYDKKKELAKLFSDKNAQISLLEKTEFKIQNLSSLSAALTQDLMSFKSSTCPTCSQLWVGPDREAKLQEKVATFKQLRQEMEFHQNAILGLPALRIDLKQIEDAIHSNDTEMQALNEWDPSKELREEKERLSSELSALQVEHEKNKYTIQLDRANKEMAIVQSYNKILSDLDLRLKGDSDILKQLFWEEESYSRELQTYTNNTSSLKDTLKATESKLAIGLDALEFEKARLSVSSEAHKLIKSYVNDLFYEFLSSVGDRASEIINKIPNMASASIYFENLKETKSGTVKEEINAILTIDGEGGVPVKSLSGGERTAIDLAVDLAVVEILEQRFNKGADFMILDEPFGGLDAVSIEGCLELLANSGSTKRLMLVDHSEETKQHISDKILVVRDGQFSRICDII